MKFKYNGNQKERLDKYLDEVLSSSISRMKIKKIIENSNVKVNSIVVQKPSMYLTKNDEVEINDEFIFENNDAKVIKPWDQKNLVNIIFENDDYLIIDKPKDLMVHPGTTNKDFTLLNILVSMNISLSNVYDFRPGIVHRLDKNTTGVMIISKTDEFFNYIQEQFKERTVEKRYVGLIKGNLKHSKGMIDAPISRDKNNRTKMTVSSDNDAKSSKTEFFVLESFKGFDLVEFNLLTGRTHQIRVHCAYLGTPIYNDPIYGKEHEKNIGQYLHSKSIKFKDMNGKEVFYESKLPDYFKQKIDTLIKV